MTIGQSLTLQSFSRAMFFNGDHHLCNSDPSCVLQITPLVMESSQIHTQANSALAAAFNALIRTEIRINAFGAQRIFRSIRVTIIYCVRDCTRPDCSATIC